MRTDMLNNTLKLGLLVAAVAASSSVFADNHTFSLGYAQTEVEGFTDLKGINAQYRYEWDSPFSLLASVSYMERKVTMVDAPNEIYKTKVAYTSFLLGPAYRFNNVVSAYALVGVAKIDSKDDEYDDVGFVGSESNSATELAYGAGVIVNPIQNLSINVGYEGSKLTSKNSDKQAFNGFNVGVGYRF